MPHHIYNQITEGLPACGEVFGDFYTVVPTYKILRAVLCLYDLPCPGCKISLSLLPSSVLHIQFSRYNAAQRRRKFLLISITFPLPCAAADVSVPPVYPAGYGQPAAVNCPVRFSALPVPSYLSSFLFAGLCPCFQLLILRQQVIDCDLVLFNCPEKFSICGNHFFSMERASSFSFRRSAG